MTRIASLGGVIICSELALQPATGSLAIAQDPGSGFALCSLRFAKVRRDARTLQM